VTDRIRVAVIAGGRSSEHAISVASADSVIEALDPARFESTLIEISRDGRWEIAEQRQSLRRGESGCIGDDRARGTDGLKALESIERLRRISRIENQAVRPAVSEKRRPVLDAWAGFERTDKLKSRLLHQA